MRKTLAFASLLLLTSLALTSICSAQTDAASFAAELFRYRVETNIVYHTANNYQNKLDVYLPADATGPTPVVVVIHAETEAPNLLPMLTANNCFNHLAIDLQSRRN